MGLFKKQPNAVEKTAIIFLDEFPAWAVKHSILLISELKNSSEAWRDILNKGGETETILTDCLTGAHIMYLKLSMPESLLSLLGGDKKIFKTISFWPKTAQNFIQLSSKYLDKEHEMKVRGERTFLDALNDFYKNNSGKPAEPLSANLATVATNFCAEQSKNFEGSPFLVADLYKIFFSLDNEQIDWISKYVLAKAKT